jgi:hypothetical protein
MPGSRYAYYIILFLKQANILATFSREYCEKVLRHISCFKIVFHFIANFSVCALMKNFLYLFAMLAFCESSYFSQVFKYPRQQVNSSLP